MLNIKNVLAFVLLVISSSAWSFIPATGIWGIDSEDNGLPGRGFQIEAENGVIVFTYFGYRPDGSTAFNYAAGPVVNNTFTATLLNLNGGTTLGGPHQNATVIDPAGTVTINFTSGKHGVIALPGEPQRAISKRPFGYADGPDGLLGTWLLTEMLGQSALSKMRTLSNKTGISSSFGNGMVITASGNFACEFVISDTLAGGVICIDSPQVTYSDTYYFKFSGDRGTGVIRYKLASGEYSALHEAHVLRVATKNGIKTGLNDGTEQSLTTHSQLVQTASFTQPREQLATEKSLSEEDMAKSEALKAWALEAQAIMQRVQ